MTSGINFPKTQYTYFKNNNVKQKEKEPEKRYFVDLPGTKRLNMHPAVIGAINGVCWFGIGSLITKGFSKLFKTPSNTPVDKCINIGLGVIAGINAYKVAKNSNKNV